MIPKVVLKANLSQQSFKDLSLQVKEIAKATEEYRKRLLTLSLRELKKTARQNVIERVGQTGYEPTGELENSFVIRREGKYVGLLINQHENSAAVEFGTGLPGAANSHPVASDRGWNYGNKPYWIYKDKENYWLTTGQTGKRFMYDALIDFKENKLQGVAIQAFTDTIMKVSNK